MPDGSLPGGGDGVESDVAVETDVVDSDAVDDTVGTDIDASDVDHAPTTVESSTAVGVAAVSGRGKGSPGWVVWSLIGLATLIALTATVNTWVERQALDTDQWVEVSDEMLANDDVREALSTFLVAELFRTVDIQSELASLLPGPTAGLAGPIAATLRTNAVGFVDQLLGSDAFRNLWTDVNTAAHTAFVRIVRDDTPDALSTADGAFVVNARSLVIAVAERIGLPGTVVERIPETSGQIVVFESSQLDTVQQVVRIVDTLSLLLFIVVVVLYAIAVFLARDRRVALRNVGWALAVSSLLVLLLQRLSIDFAVDELANAENARAAVDAVVSIATSLLNELAWAGLSLGLIIVGYAVLSGPTRAATAIRRFSAPVTARPVGAWVVALVLLALYLAFVPGFNTQRWIPALTFVVLFIVAVESLRRLVARENSPASEPSQA